MFTQEEKDAIRFALMKWRLKSCMPWVKIAEEIGINLATLNKFRGGNKPIRDLSIARIHNYLVDKKEQ